MKRYMESHGILSEHDLMFYGPEGKMTLEEADARGYEVRRYSHQGMVMTPIGHGFNVYEVANQGRMSAADLGAVLRADLAARQQSALAAQMQNSPALRYAKSQEPGGLEAGPAKHMGEPCALPRPGWRERLRQWRRR